MIDFEKNLCHVLYVLLYAVLNHSLLGELMVIYKPKGLHTVFFLAMVFKFSYSKPPGRKMVSSF